MISKRVLFIGIISLMLLQFGWAFALDTRIEQLETEIDELEDSNEELREELAANESVQTGASQNNSRQYTQEGRVSRSIDSVADRGQVGTNSLSGPPSAGADISFWSAGR